MPATTHIHSFGEEDVLFSFGIHVKRDDDFMETQSISHALPNTRRTQFVLYLEFSLSMHCSGCVCVNWIRWDVANTCRLQNDECRVDRLQRWHRCRRLETQWDAHKSPSNFAHGDWVFRSHTPAYSVLDAILMLDPIFIYILQQTDDEENSGTIWQPFKFRWLLPQQI